MRMMHFCVSNQPRLKAVEVDAEARRVRFEKIDVTNLNAPTDGHVHKLELVHPGDDSLIVKFTFLGDGKESYEEIRLRRVGGAAP